MPSLAVAPDAPPTDKPDPVRPHEVVVFVARMRADRLARGLTWQQYASLIGLSTSGLQYILSGRSNPRELTIARVKQKLGWR